jgi:hypothetical protein
MADSNPTRSGSKWLWPVLLVLLAILLLAWLLNPSGDREGEVQDPIVTGDMTEPGADGTGPVGTGLPQPGGAAPIDENAPGAGTTVDPLPE